MWLFTTFGFFSIVSKSGDPGITVRSRTRGDQLRLQRHYLHELSAPVEGKGTDYPWRAYCSAEQLAAAMPRICEQIDYANFKHEVGTMLGSARTSRYAKVWSALAGMPEDLPEPDPAGWDGLSKPPKSTSQHAYAFGGVVIDPTGRVLLREVANHFDGYVWSFAKGRPDEGESPREAALREVFEETGVRARVLVPIHGSFKGSTTHNQYFLMIARADEADGAFRSRETAGLQWALPDQARRLIELTTNAVGRKRDLQVLDAALKLLPTAIPLKRPIARSEDWKGRPMSAGRRKLNHERTFTDAEFARIIRGRVPAMMENKWFIHFRDGTLYCHRSWTGFEIFRVQFAHDEAGWRITRVDVETRADWFGISDDAELTGLLDAIFTDVLINASDEPTQQ